MNRTRTTVADLLREGTRTLREASVPSAGLDAEILLREALGLTREQLFDQLPNPVQTSGANGFRELIARRASGIPVAYITGRREFYGRDFTVNEAVLVPRPETEFLVEYAVDWLSRHTDGGRRIIDVGTGSGAIAVSVACEIDQTHQIIASDVSREALNIARTNRDRHQAPVELVAGSLLDWFHGRVDIIVANLPYLRPDQAHEGIAHEPPVALFSGQDGFELNRTLIEQAMTILNQPGSLIMELDPGQSSLALQTASNAFPDAHIRVAADLAGTDRYLIVEKG